MKGNYVSSHELKGKPRRNIQIACTFQMRWPKEVQKVPEHWRSVWKHSSTCFCMEFHWTNADWKIDISFNLSDMPTSKISLDTDKSFIPYSCYTHAIVMQHLLHDSLRTTSEKCMQLQHQRRIQWPHWKDDLTKLIESSWTVLWSHLRQHLYLYIFIFATKVVLGRLSNMSNMLLLSPPSCRPQRFLLTSWVYFCSDFLSCPFDYMR